MTEKEKILDKVRELYMKYGIKSVTMEDIAKALGMSKKTLYRFFTDKDTLVEEAMRLHLKCECKIVDGIHRQFDNAIDEMLQIGNQLAESLQNLNPSCVYDLQKYYGDCWAMFRQHKHNFIYGIITNNIKNGIKQGFYHSDLNIDITARLYIGRLEMIADAELFPQGKYSVPVVLKEYVQYHLRSIVSSKGLEYLGKIKKRQKSII